MVLVLLTGSVALAVIAFNPALLKPAIEHWFKTNYQRTLKMTGDIQLTLFPRIDLVLNDISLSEYQQDDRFVSIEQLTLTMPVMPLFNRRLEVGDFYVSGFAAELVRDQNGKFNFADLLKGDDESFISTFQISRIKMDNSRLRFRDDLTGRYYELDAMRWTAVQVETDQLQQIRMDARLSVSEMETAEKQLFMSPVKTQFEVADVLFKNQGLVIRSILLSLQSDFDHSDQLPAGRFSSHFSIAGLHWSDEMLASQHMHMEVAWQHSEKIAQVVYDSALQFNTDKMSGTLSEIHLAFDIFHPDYMRQSMHGLFNGYLNMDWPAESLEIGMQGKMDDRAVNAEARLLGFAQPDHRFRLEIDALDVSALLPAESSPSSSSSPSSGSSRFKAEASSFPDFSWLDDTGLSGAIHIGKLLAGDLQFSEIQLEIGKGDNFTDDQPE